MQREDVLHAAVAAELERGLVVLGEPRDRQAAPALVVAARRLVRFAARGAGVLCAFAAFGVKERGRADHHDRDREVAVRLPDPDL